MIINLSYIAILQPAPDCYCGRETRSSIELVGYAKSDHISHYHVSYWRSSLPPQQ